MSTDTAADLHAEITRCIDTLRQHVPKPDPDFYPEAEDAGQVCEWALDDLVDHAEDWQRRTTKLADAVEQLHNATHEGSVLMCSLPPCSGLFTETLDARKVARW